jgi:hypothetical protein
LLAARRIAIAGNSTAETDCTPAAQAAKNSVESAPSYREGSVAAPNSESTDIFVRTSGVHDGLIWGDATTFSKLTEEGPLAGSRRIYSGTDYRNRHFIFCLRDDDKVMAAWNASRDAARKLEEIANELEDADLFDDADQIRGLTATIRRHSEDLRWEAQNVPSDRF